MKDFKTSQEIDPKDFPLRSSLFLYDKVEKKYDATWGLLCDNWNAAKRDRVIQKQIEYNCNFITYYLFHAGDPNCVVNPFVGCPTAQQVVEGQCTWDWAKIERWMPFLRLGEIPGVWCVPTLFCGDDGATCNNTTFHDAFIPIIATSLHPYIDGINIASEANKTMSVAMQERVINVIKNAWKAAGQKEKFIFTHLQGLNTQVPNGAVVLYQFSWHPKYGTTKSVKDVVREGQQALAKYPYTLFQEMTIECETLIARQQSKALVKLPGCYMRPGPI